MVTTPGALAQGEGCHYDTMTRMTAMVTTMQDRLQERLPVKRTTTSSDYIIRLTDRLQSLRTKCVRFFSHGSRAGTTTKRDMTTTRVAAAACNGTDYNNCDVSTTATSTTVSDTESTTSADTDLQSTPTFTAVDNTVDLINPVKRLHSLHSDVRCRWSWQGTTTTTTTCGSSSSWSTTSHATSSSFTKNLLCLMVLLNPFRSGYKRLATS